MHRIWMTIAVVGLALGCTRKLEIKLDDVRDRQQALQSRLDMLERKLDALAQKEEATSPEIELTRKVPAVISEAETPIPPSDDLAEKMANRIMAMVKQTVEATVDARIASQVGTPDDIEAITGTRRGREARSCTRLSMTTFVRS